MPTTLIETKRNKVERSADLAQRRLNRAENAALRLNRLHTRPERKPLAPSTGDWLARAERAREAVEPVAPMSALDKAASTGAKRTRAERQLADVKNKDAMRAARQYAITGEEVAARCAQAVTDALSWADATEQADAIGWLWEKIIERHGHNPPSHKVTQQYLERRATGHVLDARDRAAKREARTHDDEYGADGEDARNAEENLEVLAHKAGGSVWAVAAPVNHLEADVLADAGEAAAMIDRLGDVTGYKLHADERAAATAALGGYGDAKEYARRENVNEATARKRLSRGIARLQNRMIPLTEEGIRAVIADARALGSSDEPMFPRLTFAQRAYARRIDRLRLSTYDRCTRSGNYGAKAMAGRLSFGDVAEDTIMPAERRSNAGRAARAAWTPIPRVARDWPTERLAERIWLADHVARLTA